MKTIVETLNAGLTVGEDHTLEQPLEGYTDADHDIWRQLYTRQRTLLQDRVNNTFLIGLEKLGLPDTHIPAFAKINELLLAATGWQLVAVPGVLPDAVFFEHLAHRRFPATWWMRRAEQLDYVPQPDVFHDVFGHAPLLIHPVYADYLQAFGEGGVRAAQLDALPWLARLYWHTVEFGLINGAQGLRVYGAGILSSKSEMQYALESPSPNRVGFDLQRVMRTRYRTNGFQRTYFVIRNYHQLFAATRQDFAPIYAALKDQPELSAGAISAHDLVLQRGDRSGWGDGEEQ